MEEEYLLIFYFDGLKTIDLEGRMQMHESKMLDFIEKYCLANGSNLEGRNDAFRYLTHTRYKPCLIISNQKGLYFLTTKRIQNDTELYLINYLELLKYKIIDNNHTLLIYKNGFQFEIPINYRIIKRQSKLIEEYLRSISFKLYKCYNNKYD